MRRRAALFAIGMAACAAREESPASAPRAEATTAAPSISTTAPAAPAGALVSTHEAQLIARELVRVSRARGIRAAREIPGVELSRQAIIARIREHVAREIPPEAIRDEGTANQLLGLIPAEFDYEQAEFGLLEAQIAGYYEPADKTMYLVEDLGDDEAEATLAHELVHALQDLRWDLAERSKYHPGESDRALAGSALAEGDATSAMFDVMFAGKGRRAVDLPDAVFADQLRAGLEQGPGADAPAVMRASLVAPYLYGVLFVHALRRRGDWDAVNHAWDDPPKTTEQLLHVDKYDLREPAIAVAAPTYAALGAGWSTLDADTYGELGARIDFEDWVDAPVAARAAAGWGGDRAVLVQRGESVAFAWRLRYDAGRAAPDDLAKSAFAVLAPGIERHVGKAAAVERGAFVCVDRRDRGPLAVGRSGRDIVILAGPAHASGRAWSADGDCSLARAWMNEVLQPAGASP